MDLPARYRAQIARSYQRAVADAVLRRCVVMSARLLRVSVTMLTGPRRCKDVAHKRMIAMATIRSVLGTSYPRLGLAFGGRDHSTAISACRRVASDPELRDRSRWLRQDLFACLERWEGDEP